MLTLLFASTRLCTHPWIFPLIVRSHGSGFLLRFAISLETVSSRTIARVRSSTTARTTNTRQFRGPGERRTRPKKPNRIRTKHTRESAKSRPTVKARGSVVTRFRRRQQQVNSTSAGQPSLRKRSRGERGLRIHTILVERTKRSRTMYV